MSPRISVLMAVYNGGSLLGPAIESILRQSEKQFELLIVDDGSTDDSVATIERFKDPRIRLIRHDTNQGLAASLNTGLAEVRGEYIARLDADDLALADRLAKQADYLDRHPDIGLLGSNAVFVDEAGHRIDQSDHPRSPLAVRWTSLLQNPFIHSTVMMRRSLLMDNALRYDAQMTTTQDYDLWLRCLAHSDGANLAEPTILFRIHGASISSRRPDIQLHNTISLTGAAIEKRFGSEIVCGADRCAIFDAIFAGRREAAASGVDRVAAAHRYYDLLDAFLAQRPDGCEAECRRRACTRVVQMVLFPPMPKGGFGLWRRSLRIDPALPIHLIRLAAFRISQRMKAGQRVEPSMASARS